MPKSAKLKMNVRHGEVTIAATIKNGTRQPCLIQGCLHTKSTGVKHE